MQCDNRLCDRRDQGCAGPCPGATEQAGHDTLATEREGVAGHRVVVADHAREDACEKQDMAGIDDGRAVAEERLGHIENQVRALLLSLADHVAGADGDGDRPTGYRVDDTHDGDREVGGRRYRPASVACLLREDRGRFEAHERCDGDSKRRTGTAGAAE